ncbi:hypothetical protein CL176_03145 [Suicoccus acidiformans]|uniref:Aromatic acid exporter family protein n=1 Tax=Suicoccus acidiformans TaxID=2036206 RepID=A0A347WJ47_9LACT|nr:aromatic acid exporter family protein [Suicoccus acidiformans]AXY25104.1 hypothetical protein CL176_03145 [Suicoccus acidiformans]
MKIGARVLKTGLSITLSILISMYLIPDNSPALAGIAAITTTMQSVKKSYESFRNRLLANSIGGIVAVILSYTLGTNPVSIGIAAIILIGVLNALKLSDVLNLAVITVVAVMTSVSNNLALTALYRVLETFIGVTISFLINSLIYPPRYDQRFYDSLTNLTNEILILIRATLRQNITFSIMHQDIVWARNELKQVEQFFDLIRNEVILSKKERYVVARRLVIYRHMITATRATIRLLDTMHNQDAVFASFPDDLRLMIRERVELLMVAHEQVMMKLSGRVSAENVKFIRTPYAYREEYVQKFFDQAWKFLEDKERSNTDVNGVIHIMSAIYRYEESINNLNNILSIYARHYHSEENVVEDSIHSN